MVWRPDVTVAAVIERGGHYLMVEERADGRIVFNQPAGHLEEGEALVDAVRREAREETGREFHPEALVGIYRLCQRASRTTFLRVCFTGRCGSEHSGRPLDADIIRSVWMTRDELLTVADRLRSPLVLRCIDDYSAGARFPLAVISDLGSL